MLKYLSDNPILAQSSYGELPLMPLPKAKDRILVVVPHPDDETLGMAGYMQRAVKAGATVHVVIVSDGNRRGKAVRRKREVTEALRMFGLTDASTSFYNLPDGKLVQHAQVLGEQLEAEVRSFLPTVVLVTDPEDIHPDHAVLGKLLVAISQHGLLPLTKLYTSLIHYHRFPRPLGNKPGSFLLPPMRLLEKGGWCSFELSENELKVKSQAIKVYKSQLYTPFLRGLLFSFIRKNELFRQLT
jgi:LmbE family N-acetylglucosaminyl deacetylase